MKRRALIFPLVLKLSKIYFSDLSFKENEYKRTLFYTLKDMGGVYIKFLQAISVTRRFMDGWGGPKEFDVFNQVMQEPIDFGGYIKNRDQFDYIEAKPFATGSFAQIYKAKLKTGEMLVLKVLRPSIVVNLKADLKKIKRIIKITWESPELFFFT